MRDFARIVVRRRPHVFACIGVTIGVSSARGQRPHVSAAVQDDEIPSSMFTVECRRAEQTDIARRVSTLVSCRPPLSTGIAVSFAVKAAIKLRPLDAEPMRHGDAQEEADFQVQSERAIRRHWTLVCCAFAFCWWAEGQRQAYTGSPAPRGTGTG